MIAYSALLRCKLVRLQTCLEAINANLIAGEFLFMLNWHHIGGILKATTGKQLSWTEELRQNCGLLRKLRPPKTKTCVFFQSIYVTYSS